MKNANTDYLVIQKIVHWVMAALIMLDLIIAQKFGDPMADWDRFESRVDHTSVSLVVTVLFVIRIYLRWKHGAPPLPTTMTRWQTLAAQTVHWGFYVLIGSLITFGLLAASHANSEIVALGVIQLSDGLGLTQDFQFFRSLHEFVTEALIVLITVHILAAIYHLAFTTDRSTQNMLQFWRSLKS